MNAQVTMINNKCTIILGAWVMYDKETCAVMEECTMHNTGLLGWSSSEHPTDEV
jgi:hypothetical protein